MSDSGVTRTHLSSPGELEHQLLLRLIEQIASGQPRQTRDEIDQLLARKSIQRQTQLSVRLQTIRSIAELEVARIELAARYPLETRSIRTNTVNIMLQFIRQVLPALSSKNDSGSDSIEGDRLQEASELGGRAFAEKFNLTSRELEVLKLVALGLTNQQTAAALFISEATVKKHLSSLMAKLNATNRTHAASLARAMGVIEVPASTLSHSGQTDSFVYLP